MKLYSKVVIITGASSGIGKAIVKLFLREGANIIAVSRNIDAKAYLDLNNDLKLSEEELIERVLIQKGDISKITDVEKIVNKSIEHFGHIDIVISNAGITDRTSVLDSSVEDWERVLNTNLTGAYLISKSVLPFMIEQKNGNFIFISSIGAIVSWENETAYQVSKNGLVGLSRSMAIDYAPYNIRVNCVCPGLIDAPMFTNWLKQNKHNEIFLQEVLAKIPLKRLGSPQEVANVVLFLASDDSSYITGTSLTVDGGFTAI